MNVCNSVRNIRACVVVGGVGGSRHWGFKSPYLAHSSLCLLPADQSGKPPLLHLPGSHPDDNELMLKLWARPYRLEHCLTLVWLDYYTLAQLGRGRVGHKQSNKGGSWAMVSIMQKNTHAVLEDTSFIRRRQGIVIPQEEWLFGSMWWYVFGWGNIIKGASFLYSGTAGTKRRNLIKSYRKKKKVSPVRDVSVIR